MKGNHDAICFTPQFFCFHALSNHPSGPVSMIRQYVDRTTSRIWAESLLAKLKSSCTEFFYYWTLIGRRRRSSLGKSVKLKEHRCHLAGRPQRAIYSHPEIPLSRGFEVRREEKRRRRSVEMSYVFDANRYDGAQFRRCGRSGIVLPPVSLGLWQNFGGVDVFETGRAVIRRAFDRGVTHFDLANNYGPPYGSAEENFGKILRKDLRNYRDELIISSKAGWDMWPGPYGVGGSRKYLLASLDGSLRRIGLEYVDIFYSHRPTMDVPLEETMGALVQAVRQGKALYVGISSYGPERTREAAQILKSEGVPLLIHQPSYSMLNRWVEKELLATLEELGVGCIAFSPLAQGLLTNKYLNGVPENSRAKAEGSFQKDFLSEENLKRVRALSGIARGRGQTLAQMAIAWVLRDKRVTSALIGARNVEQLDNSLDAVKKLQFTDAELNEIDRYAQEGAIDLWRNAREGAA
jgi:L-glyceraldehyde 3-phosphate reductase